MKRCDQCQYENQDAMSFCLQCGQPLAAAPANYAAHTGETVDRTAPDTLYDQSAPTVFGAPPLAPTNFAPTNFASTANARPKNGKKIFLILGGVFSLFGLLLASGALIIFFNWKSRTAAISTPNASPAPTRGIAVRQPSPKSSGSPSVSLSDSPSDSLKTIPNDAPQVSFTPPSEPTKKGTFTVYANAGWQLSELATVPLENFRTSATGLIDLADVKTSVSAKGVTDAKSKARRIYTEYPTGALIMRTRYADGKYSNVQPVTAAPSVGVWRNFPDERGRLEFCINDNAPAENGGHFTVTKTSTSVPQAKK